MVTSGKDRTQADRGVGGVVCTVIRGEARALRIMLDVPDAHQVCGDAVSELVRLVAQQLAEHGAEGAAGDSACDVARPVLRLVR